MTNYKVFRITQKQQNGCSSGDYVLFDLDDYVTYSCSTTRNKIFCVDSSPFNTWQVGDYLEIDLDKTQHKDWSGNFSDLSIVRKAYHNTVVQYSNHNQTLAIGRSIDASLIDQSGGKNEYEAKIHLDPNTSKISGYSIIGRRRQ